MKNAAWDILEILINIYQGIAAMYFPFKYLGGKYSDKFIKNYGMPFSLALALSISIFNHITFFEHIYAVFYGILIFVYSVFCLKDNIYNKLFVSMYSLIVLLLSGAAVAWLMSMIFNVPLESILTESSGMRLSGLIFTQIVIFYLYYLSIKIFGTKNNSCLTGIEAVLISVILILSIIIVLILCFIEFKQDNMRNRQLVAISFACVILINIVTLYITVDLENKNNTAIENEKLKLLLTYNKQYIENADTEYQLIRKLRHDTKDVYRVIDDYLESNDVENARKYIRQMVDIADDRIIFVNTQNNAVNAIINSKLTIAKSFGINATCLSINEFDGIDDIDLCRLLSNMLENAITATSNIKLKDKQINLKILLKSDKYTFLIKNSIDASVLKENPKLRTTKTKFDSHGYGVKIIRDIAKKYNGHCDFYEEENMFCCLAVLIPNEK